MEKQSQCQVCFADTSEKTTCHYNAFIKCLACGQAAHRYCYAPNCQDPVFICDPCSRDVKKAVCQLCLNPGLLKQVGEGFGHPICLLLSADAVVAKFGNLSFLPVESQPRKRQKCEYCKQESGSVLGCGSKGCFRKAHFYCALKKCAPEVYQGWRVVYRPLEGLRDNADFYTNSFQRFLQTHSKFLSQQLNLRKGFRTKEKSGYFYCEGHGGTIIECNCNRLDEAKTDWLFCEGCLRWEHRECIQPSENNRRALANDSPDESYICEQCYTWRRWVDDSEEEMPELLPKLQLYDFVFLNCLLEQQADRSSIRLRETVKRCFILPSLEFAEAYYKPEVAKRLKPRINLP
jgi:hypothetical protein